MARSPTSSRSGSGSRCESEIETSGTRRKYAIERLQLGQVEPAVQRRHVTARRAAAGRKAEIVDVEMHDVEVVGAPRTCSSMSDMRRQIIAASPCRGAAHWARRHRASPWSCCRRWRTASPRGRARPALGQVETTRSVPPYSFGGTASINGATWAIFMVSPEKVGPEPPVPSCLGDMLRDSPGRTLARRFLLRTQTGSCGTRPHHARCHRQTSALRAERPP